MGTPRPSKCCIHTRERGGTAHSTRADFEVRDTHENGGWPPHLHFQLSNEQPTTHDMPGAVTPAERKNAQMCTQTLVLSWVHCIKPCPSPVLQWPVNPKGGLCLGGRKRPYWRCCWAVKDATLGIEAASVASTSGVFLFWVPRQRTRAVRTDSP